MRRALILLTSLCLAASCYGGDEDAPSDRPPGAPRFGSATVLIDRGEGSILIRAEVAETPEQHRFGLMHRRSLDDDAGMLFLFFEEQSSGFWMKDTLIPLSIAFFDVDGRIVDILDMDPCEADPCRVYTPDASYMGALEVNQGMFDEWGVREGDLLQITR